MLEEKKKAITESAKKLAEMNFGNNVPAVIGEVKAKAEQIYGEAQSNPKLAMLRLLRSMDIEGLKGLTTYNTNKVEQRAEQVCLKLMTSAIPSFAKISDDIDNAKQTILQIINMVFVANFFKTNSTWDWKGFEKVVEVEVGVKETSMSLATSSGATPGVDEVAEVLANTRME